MERKLGKIDLSDLCVGATVLGTGGGGSPELGLFLLNRVLEMGKEVRLLSADEISDEAIVVHPAMVGSIAPSKNKTLEMEEYGEKILSEEGPLLSGLRMMERELSEKVCATVPVEIGGYNTPIAAILAALANIPFVDGDTIGRAKPELMMQTYTVMNIPITPMILNDMRGNSILVRKVGSFRDAEKIARAMAVVGDGTTAVRCPVKGKVLKKAIIPGGVSKAMEIGKAFREAKETGKDPILAVIQASGGEEIFRGEVFHFDWEDREGFLWGTLIVRGEKQYKGHELKIWMKNENLISWFDGKPYVVSPDLICILDSNTGEAITNSKMREGRKIVVFAIPTHPFWRSPEAIDLVSPKHFGFDIPYIPMEELIHSF
ncbi:MAG: DUF917 domain-containing protein [Candidatus Methanomethylicaceae archaeon]